MIHIIAGQRFETIVRSVRTLAPTGHATGKVKYKLQVGVEPILTEAVGRDVLDAIEAAVDEALSFVAAAVKQQEIEIEEVRNGTQDRKSDDQDRGSSST